MMDVTLRMFSHLGEKHRLALLMTFSLLTKGIIVALTPLVNHDGPHYLVAAQEIAAGRFLESLRVYSMPFYPLLIAGANLFVDDWIKAGQLISFLSLTLAIVPLYKVTRMIFGPAAAWWAGVAYAVWPLANDLTSTVFRDPPFILFSSLAVWAGALALTADRKKRHFLLGSLAAAAAFLCRMEGALLFPIFVSVWLVLSAVRPAERIALVKGIGVFLLLPLAAAALYVLLAGDGLEFNRLADTRQRLQDIFGGGFLANYRTVYARVAEIESTLPFGKWGGDFAEIGRHHLWLVYGVGLLDRLAAAVSPVLLLFAFPGFRQEPENRLAARFLLAVLAGNLLFLFLFYLYYTFLEVRYAAFPAFLLFPWIGAGLERIAAWSRRCLPRFGPAFLLLLLCCFGGFRVAKGVAAHQDLTVRDAGTWLAQQPDLSRAPLVSNDCRVSYFAGRFRSYVPFNGGDDYAAMEQAALGSGGEVLVIRTTPPKAGSVPDFGHYRKIAEFAGRKHVVFIYRRQHEPPSATVSLPRGS